jgi:hypothetical protein
MAKFKNAMVAALLAVTAIGCGELSEDVTSYTNSYVPAPTAPAEPTVTEEDEGEPNLVEDGCEAFGLVYDAANNTCVDDEFEINVIDPGPPHVEEPGDLGGVIDPPTVNEVDDIIIEFGFTVTPGKRKLVATWTNQPLVSSYRIERTKEGNSYSNDSYPTGTSWTYATTFCSAHSFKLIATMMDGEIIESEATDFLKPTNCE